MIITKSSQNTEVEKLKIEMIKLKKMIQKREDEVSVLVKIIEKHKLAVQKKIPLGEINQNVVEAKQEDVEKLRAKKKLAFEKFRQHHSKNQAIGENKSVLREKFTLAREMGESANAARMRMNGLKEQLTLVKQDIVMNKLEHNDKGVQKLLSKESQIVDEINEAKRKYKCSYKILKQTKTQIEHLKLILDKNREGMQEEFELEWIKQIQARKERKAKRKEAWGHNIPSTGNQSADADISRFYEIRQRIMKS